MKKTNNKRGISLIVLVITIIVIIILAVAVILTLSNNNPIENAKKAVSANDEATLKEEATLLYADWYLLKNTGDGTETRDAESYVKDNLQGDYGELKDRLTVTDSGVITISEPLKKVEGVVIPNGFEHVSGTTVATGLVIKNSTDDNEFVWVPVETGTFTKTVRTNSGGVNTEEPYTEGGTITESDEITEYEAMVASVSKYGGFYMGRYEASQNETTGKAQSIANKTSWNQIAWGTSMTDLSGGAVGAARAVYPDSNEKTTGEAVSTLVYGIQWDATVRFFEQSYDDLNTNYDYGHSNASEAIPTGSNSDYALNNIYDMAGNLQEWTMEATSWGARVLRGCPYMGMSSVSFYDPDITYSTTELYDGFRIALYIK